MQSKKVSFFFWLFVLSLFCSMSTAAETSVFWRATAKDSQPVFLFGTMHSDDNRVTDFSQQTLDAIAASEVFMLETKQPRSSEPLLSERMLTQDLSGAEIDQLNLLVDQYVIPRALAVKMKPWLLAVMLAAPKPPTPFGQDQLLMAEAENRGKRVVPLESVEDHFGVMDDVSREEQLTLLKSVLKRSPDQKEADFEEVLTAYLSGDLTAILTTNAKTTGDLVNKALWEKMRQRLIETRNLKMATSVINAAKNNSLFVAVGASHLAGESGLVNQLKQAGFKLESLKPLKHQ